VVYPSPAKRTAALERLRQICLALPETSERPSHGAPSFFVRDKKCFLMLLDHHHGDGRASTGSSGSQSASQRPI
jgi:hypothetical protein